jgi:hypothetical protein
MSKHTLGPWQYAPLQWNGDHVNESPGSIVGGDDGRWFIATLESLYDEAENAANARLIAAAPELLESLRSLLEWAVSTPLLDDDLLAENEPEVIRARTVLSRLE